LNHWLSLELSSASLRNWNDGMGEYWNVGFGKLGEWGIGVMGGGYWVGVDTVINGPDFD
jgi:hypothetical protein